MKSILFVDDEPNVLSGLKRMLYPLRNEWNMTFAASGSEALKVLAGGQCDVIVTDMRMPDISGADLLRQVSREYPRIVRIVLSGMCDREQALASAVSAHQFLSKPCDPATLKKAVDRALSTNGAFQDGAVKSFISRLESLPSMPSIYMELVNAAREPDVPVRKLGGIISRDVAMTSKVLHLVNSALFGIRRPVIDPGEACVYLGADTIQTLVLSIGVFSQYRQRGIFSVEQLQTHSMQTASLARKIATFERWEKAHVDEAFLAGMLHDVGKLVLAINCADEYDECLKASKREGRPLVEVETEHFGHTHADAGKYLLQLWGLPDAVTEAVALHHRPGLAVPLAIGPLTSVHVANVLGRERETPTLLGLDLDYLAKIHAESKLPQWRELCRAAKDGPVQ